MEQSGDCIICGEADMVEVESTSHDTVLECPKCHARLAIWKDDPGVYYKR